MDTHYAFDGFGQMTSIEHKDGAAVLDGWTYGMDGGAITAITAEDGSRWAYEHDANSRLTKAERYDTDGTSLLHRYSYTYDDADNMLTKAVYDAGADSTTNTVFAYGDANLLTSQSVGGTTTSFAYDDWGRMTSRSDGTYSATYAYRYGDKLYSVTSDFPSEGNATYQYDGAGKRRQKTAGGTTTKYRWDRGWNVLNEEDNLGSLMLTRVINSPLAETAGILGDVAGTNPATGAYRYYASDHLGSTRGLYDGSKSALGSYEYSPYGEVYASTGSVSNITRRYTGHDWDDAAELYYAPYRYYAPGLARWITRDPLGTIDGPNVYAYVGDSPILRVDRLGLCSNSLCKQYANSMFRDCMREAKRFWRRNKREMIELYDKAILRIDQSESNCRINCEKGYECWPLLVRLCEYGCSTQASIAKKIAIATLVSTWASNDAAYSGNMTMCKTAQLLQHDVCNQECLEP